MLLVLYFYTLLLYIAATRETAFIHAITTAGVSHAVTRACSSGRLERCGCDRSVEGGATTVRSSSPANDVTTGADGGGGGGGASKAFQWAGCSDNVAYGSAFSKSFVDAREIRPKRRDSAKTLMNLHNNNAGRKVGLPFIYCISNLVIFHPPLVVFCDVL